MELDIDPSILEGRVDQGQLPQYVHRAQQLLARQFHDNFAGDDATMWPYYVQQNLPGVLQGLIIGSLPMTDEPLSV